ncbi:MAG: hypothetical protein AAFV74_23760, partial [Pseudomonadota bacterium]
WIYSNEIEKLVVNNYTDGGIIEADEERCDGYDPNEIVNVTSPSGGIGGATEYIWEFDNGSGWTVIAGATADSYDPGAITVSTTYRRGSRRAPCTDWIYSNEVEKLVVNNYTDGGVIEADEERCDGYDPDAITNVTSPSGGIGGATEYIWEFDNGSGWTVIGGATADSYDPGAITVSTTYRRGSRRAPC